MKKIPILSGKCLGLLSLLAILKFQIRAQGGYPPAPIAEQDFTLWYVSFFVLCVVLGVVVVWWMKANKDKKIETPATETKKSKQGKNNWEREAVDAEKELEWYRKNQKVISKNQKDKKYPNNLPKTSNVLPKKAIRVEPNYEEVSLDQAELENRIKKVQFAELPINSFLEIKPSKPFEMLPISNDADLMSAVEQSQDEFEEDEQVRELAVRILTAFRTRNSAESLGQIALYDISSNLRAKAVATLADFDHESVFENLLLACADPAREVKASAARGLFRLSFDRADAWTRIAETNNEFRMRQAVRAAVEANLIERSFDRLIHPDLKIAYEAFTLTVLLIKSRETERIFTTLENHQDDGVKLALLHVLKVVKDEETLPMLFDLLDNPKISETIRNKADEVIKSFDMVPA